jgi:hypothetical protein
MVNNHFACGTSETDTDSFGIRRPRVKDAGAPRALGGGNHTHRACTIFESKPTE